MSSIVPGRAGRVNQTAPDRVGGRGMGPGEVERPPDQRLALAAAVSAQPQQTGVLFIITQQVQPAFIMRGHAVAAGLDHLAALLSPLVQVMRAALVGHLALAHAHRQVAAADHHAVHHHAAAAHAAGQHRAEVLHHAAGHRVVAGAGDLHAAVALLHLHACSAAP